MKGEDNKSFTEIAATVSERLTEEQREKLLELMKQLNKEGRE